AGPPGENPVQQGSKATGGIEFGTLATLGTSFFVLGLVELAESLSDGVVGGEQQGSELQGDGGQAASVGQHHAEAVQGEDEGLGNRQLWETAGDGIGPLVEWQLARHDALGDAGWCCVTSSIAGTSVSPSLLNASVAGRQQLRAVTLTAETYP